MPIENRWYVPDHVALNRMFGDVTVEELAEMNRINQTYYEHLSGSQLVHFIVDLTGVSHMPSDMRAARVVSPPRPDTGWIILVSSNPLHRMISGMVALIARLNTKVVASKEEALEFLRTHDASLWPELGQPHGMDSDAEATDVP